MNPIREKIKLIIYGTDTKAGKIFDLLLIITIVLSIITVLLDSIDDYQLRYGDLFIIAEWTFTILFTIEYSLIRNLVDKLSVQSKIKSASGIS